MGKIYIIGLGPGDEEHLTIKAQKAFKANRKTYLRTIFHPTISYLDREGIPYESFDNLYDSIEDFNELYKSISDKLLENAEVYKEINYCVPGHPLVAEKTVKNLLDQEKVEVEIIDGLSFIEPILKAMKRDPVDGLKIIDGLNLNQNPDINMDNLITQIYDRERASDLKLSFSEIYGDEYEVYIISGAGNKNERKEKMPLYEIDRIDWYDYLTSIYIPKVEKNNKNIYDFNDLLRIMEKLRGPDGCSWDIKQDHNTLRKYLIEEAYEVIDAIDQEDEDSLKEELGDLLLQIVFHSEIAKELGEFNVFDVIKSISEKMINRHPNIFENSKFRDLENWNDIKAKEKNFYSHTERLKAVPKTLPALMRSQKVQKRAKDAGFDWEGYEGALAKVEEEVQEVKTEIEQKGNFISEEIGDLLFSVVNLTRFFNIDPEYSLTNAIEKFIIRFEKVEKELEKQNKKMNEISIEKLDEIWNYIKKIN